MHDTGPKYYQEMSIWEIAQLLHLATHDHLLYFRNKEGSEVKLEVVCSSPGKIVLAEMED